jgi:DedD protein
MSLFSILRKNKQEPASGKDAFYSRAEEESNAARGRSKRTGKNGDRTPVDAVLPEKKRARRRLIGAIALVLAAVIGLPMILDSEPKPLGDDVTIQIPSKDKSTKPAGSTPPVAAPSSGVDATTSLDPDEEVIEPHSAQGDSARVQPATPMPQRQAAAAPVAPAVPSQASAPKPKEESKLVKSTAAPKAESKSEPKMADERDETARAAALLEGKADPKASAEKKSGKFVIQVAALATKEKVNELQNKLKDAGIKSYTQKVATDSGDRIRIRVGPFASKDEADKARAKIVKLGLSGTIVPA